MHLNTEELVDIADGARSEMSAPHLSVCEPCRSQLRDLRAMIAATQEVDVPEPSPLFWDHLSARVLDAVSTEPLPTSPQVGLASARAVLASVWRARTFQASAILALAVLILVFASRSIQAPSPVAPVASVADAGAAIDRLSGLISDDVSLTLVASLTDGQDLEVVREAGLAPGGTAEHAVAQMSAGELQELGRLLKEELARPGA